MAGSPPRQLVFDTNPLLLVVPYNHFRSKSVPGTQRLRALNKVRAQSPELPPGVFDERWFGFRGAGRRITTQHVIAEALKIERQGWLLDHKDEVWESMFSLLGEFPVEEHPCSFDELRADSYRRVMIELGPTDAGLLLIATRCKATLVTEDRHLLHWAHDLAVPALPINQIGRS